MGGGSASGPEGVYTSRRLCVHVVPCRGTFLMHWWRFCLQDILVMLKTVIDEFSTSTKVGFRFNKVTLLLYNIFP